MVLIGFLFLMVVIAEQVEEVDVGADSEKAGVRHSGTDHAGADDERSAGKRTTERCATNINLVHASSPTFDTGRGSPYNAEPNCRIRQRFGHDRRAAQGAHYRGQAGPSTRPTSDCGNCISTK
jgi:hypothetical protein